MGESDGYEHVKLPYIESEEIKKAESVTQSSTSKQTKHFKNIRQGQVLYTVTTMPKLTTLVKQ